MIFPDESEKIYNALQFDLQLFAEGGDKTEEPTDKKRRDARKKGQVARSQELNAAFVLLAGFFVIKLFKVRGKQIINTLDKLKHIAMAYATCTFI